LRDLSDGTMKQEGDPLERASLIGPRFLQEGDIGVRALKPPFWDFSFSL
jgi:hypothetical protein